MTPKTARRKLQRRTKRKRYARCSDCGRRAIFRMLKSDKALKRCLYCPHMVLFMYDPSDRLSKWECD